MDYFIVGSLDGFSFKAPWYMRMLGRLIRGRSLRNRLKPGLSLPRNMRAAIPKAGTSWGDATQALQKSIEINPKQDAQIPLDLKQELHVRADKLHVAYRRWLHDLGVTTEAA